MRTPVAAAFFALLVPSLAAGQATVDDGIRAMVGQDYQTAARILRPLAENATAPDPTAQFFMAMLYSSGHGIAFDRMRACALFVSATTPANPFMQHASMLANSIREEMGRGAEFCVFRGPWGDAAPGSFRLGADHRVEITSGSITIHYNGAQQRIGTSGGPGMVYLPPKYTPLDVTSPARARRHFLEQFIWWPDVPERPTAWTLGWMLAEISGVEYLHVAAERSLVTVTAPRPPAAFDVAGFARVRANASGEAEWHISGSTNPRSGVIPVKDPR
jgi:TPR repeat protein